MCDCYIYSIIDNIVIFTASLTTLLDQLVELHQTETGPDRLVREAAQGHTDVVKDIITKFPDKVSQYNFYPNEVSNLALTLIWSVIKPLS
jgi:hypothetical protein